MKVNKVLTKRITRLVLVFAYVVSDNRKKIFDVRGNLRLRTERVSLSETRTLQDYDTFNSCYQVMEKVRRRCLSWRKSADAEIRMPIKTAEWFLHSFLFQAFSNGKDQLEWIAVVCGITQSHSGMLLKARMGTMIYIFVWKISCLRVFSDYYVWFQLKIIVRNNSFHVSHHEWPGRNFTMFLNLVIKENVPQNPKILLSSISGMTNLVKRVA